MHKKIVFFSIKNPNLANLFIGTKVSNITLFEFVQYLLTLELKVFIGKYFLTLESGTLYKEQKKRDKKQTFSNLKQDHQCSLPQVGYIGGDNIFPFM